ncbi:MAG: hypothetical protein WC364_03665 [Eubacteriales bacterium]|jgi:hypothetical protein
MKKRETIHLRKIHFDRSLIVFDPSGTTFISSYYWKGRLSPVLDFPVKPMLLEKRSRPFDSREYLFEWKVDGIRLLMFYNNKVIRLQSRTGRDCTSAFFELSPEISAREAVLDGEVTVLTNGRPDFEAVMQRYLSSPTRLNKTSWKTPVSYVVWDILWNDGKSTMDLPLIVFGYSKKDGGILVGGDRIQGHAIGMSPDERTVLKELLDQYGKVEGQAVYLPLGIKGRVKFTTWTAKGNMRDCTWVSFET